MILKIIRAVLGQIILALNFIFRPKAKARTPEDQKRVDAITSAFTLYQFKSCPFCVKVRRAIRRENLKIELRDAARNPDYKAELINGGGEYQVPCLRIKKPDGSYQWMYESSDIIEFLSAL